MQNSLDCTEEKPCSWFSTKSLGDWQSVTKQSLFYQKTISLHPVDLDSFVVIANMWEEDRSCSKDKICCSLYDDVVIKVSEMDLIMAILTRM